jgi:hypothetical protein
MWLIAIKLVHCSYLINIYILPRVGWTDIQHVRIAEILEGRTARAGITWAMKLRFIHTE